MKMFAIFSVVSAHCSSVRGNAGALNLTMSNLLSTVGICGVTIFYLLAGYFFCKSKASFKAFLIKKVNQIIVPWMFCGTFVYLYVALRKDGVSMLDLGLWLIGFKTYLYFLTHLILFYLLFYKFRNNLVVNLVAIFISCCSNIYTSVSSAINELIIPYLNPFNWMGYFALGIIFRNTNFFQLTQNFFNKFRYYFLFLFFLTLVLIVVLLGKINYWTNYSLLFQSIFFFMIFGFSQKQVFQSKILILIGKESFAIYLLHMPIAGIVTNIANRCNIPFEVILRPLIVILTTCSSILIWRWVSRKLGLSNYLMPLIGCRG